MNPKSERSLDFWLRVLKVKAETQLATKGRIDPSKLTFQSRPPGLTPEQYEHYQAQVERIKAAPTIERPKVALGIDASLTNTGFCIMEEDGSWQSGFVRPNELLSLPAKLDHIMNGVTRMVHDYWEPKPMFGLIEQGFSSKMGPSESKLGMVRGVILTQLHRLSVPSRLIPALTIKKFATGKGNATKEEVYEAAVSRGFEHSTQRLSNPTKKQIALMYDESDAFCMSEFALALLGVNPGDRLSSEQFDYARTYYEEPSEEQE